MINFNSKIYSKYSLLIILLSLIAYSNSLHSQWIQVHSLSKGYVNTFAYSNNYLFAGLTENGVILSTDYGSNWQSAVNGLTENNVRALAFSGTELYAGTFAGVFLTTDYGSSWNNTGMMMNTNVHTIAIDGNTIYAGVHGGGGIFQSRDKGKTWINVDNGLTNYYVNKLLIKGMDIFAGTQNGIFVSKNEGTSWSLSLENVNTTSLAYFDTYILAGTEGTGLYYSSDNGITWYQSSLNQFFINEIVVADSYILVATSGGVYLSSDYCKSWAPFNTGLTNRNVKSLIVSDSYLFAGTYDGVIWRRPILDIFTSVIKQNKDYYENSLTLLNVSDNNNQILTISFKISTNEYVLLRVFNELGNCIETLASEELSPGEYQRHLDMSQKPNGVYFIFLQAGSRIDNKKFLLFR